MNWAAGNDKDQFFNDFNTFASEEGKAMGLFGKSLYLFKIEKLTQLYVDDEITKPIFLHVLQILAPCETHRSTFNLVFQ